MIYELLVRDFTDERNYQTILDTLDYLDRLGINAIEFMPVNEFNGNDSWGYNPTFYLALDKAYGDKSTFKQLVNAATNAALQCSSMWCSTMPITRIRFEDVLECFVLPACCEQPVVQ